MNYAQHASILRRFIIAVIAFSISLLSATAAAQGYSGTLKKIKESGGITLGVRESSVPFSYYNNQQQVVGYGRDFAQLVIESLKKELQLPNLKVNEIPITSQNRLTLLGNGTVDLECGSTTNNTERARQVTFANNYFVVSVRMLVRADSGIKDWPDLVGKTVVTVAGTTDERDIQKLNQEKKMNLKIISGKEHSEAFLLLQSGRAVAFVMDDILLYGDRTTAKHPGDWVVVGTPLAKDAYACMLRKDDPQFEKLVNTVLAKAMASGQAAAIHKKWFQSPIPPKGLNLEFPISPDLAAFFKKPNNTPFQ